MLKEKNHPANGVASAPLPDAAVEAATLSPFCHFLPVRRKKIRTSKTSTDSLRPEETQDIEMCLDLLNPADVLRESRNHGPLR